MMADVVENSGEEAKTESCSTAVSSGSVADTQEWWDSTDGVEEKAWGGEEDACV